MGQRKYSSSLNLNLMTQIICLANSWKHKGRCIAGVEPTTGRWIRPVSNLDDGRIPINFQKVNYKDVGLLDIIEIPIADTGPDFGFESENRLILPGDWHKLGQASVEDLFTYCKQEKEILHNSYRYVTVPFMQALPFIQRRTLQLVETIEFSASVTGQRPEGGNKWQGSLVTTNGQRLVARITDPMFVERLESGHKPQHHCLVTVSLGMPWRPPNWEGDLPCWKLIAAVIELTEAGNPDPRIEAHRQEEFWICLHTIVSTDSLSVFPPEDSVDFESPHSNSPTAIDSDTSQVIQCSRNNLVNFWDIASGEIVRNLIINSADFYPTVISTNGRFLANFSDGDSIQIWDLQTGRILRTFIDGSESPNLISAEFSPNSEMIATGGKKVNIWNLPSRRLTHILDPSTVDECSDNTGVCTYLGFSADSKILVSVIHPSVKPQYVAIVWSLENQEVIRTFLDEHEIGAAAFSPNGKKIAIGNWNGDIKLYNLDTGELEHTFSTPSGIVESIAFHPSRQVLASGSGSHPGFGRSGTDDNVNLWSLNSKALICTLSGHSEIVGSIAFTADGESIVSTSWDGAIKIWKRAK